MTIPSVPENLMAELKKRADAQGKPLHEVVIETLIKGVGDLEQPAVGKPKRDLSDIVGTMTAEDARAIEEVVREMDSWDLEANS